MTRGAQVQKDQLDLEIFSGSHQEDFSENVVSNFRVRMSETLHMPGIWEGSLISCTYRNLIVNIDDTGVGESVAEDEKDFDSRYVNGLAVLEPETHRRDLYEKTLLRKENGIGLVVGVADYTGMVHSIFKDVRELSAPGCYSNIALLWKEVCRLFSDMSLRYRKGTFRPVETVEFGLSDLVQMEEMSSTRTVQVSFTKEVTGDEPQINYVEIVLNAHVARLLGFKDANTKCSVPVSIRLSLPNKLLPGDETSDGDNEWMVVHGDIGNPANINGGQMTNKTIIETLERYITLDQIPNQGIENNVHVESDTHALTGHWPSNLTMGVDFIFIYADGLVENTYVANESVPILAVVPIQGKVGDIVYHSINTPLEKRIATQNMNVQRFELLDSFGKKIRFLQGSQAHLTIHLERVDSS